MVSAFMPDIQVEIAFNAGYTTPSASRTWTDVSAYVELAAGIDIDFGRQDERSTADANSLTLTLDNKDGRFTAFRTGSPYYPNVKIGRPIRVKVTPPGGSTVTRFVGFIDEWPVEWDGTDAYAKANITASSRMARLGLTAKLRSMIEQEILARRPQRYWTLGDPSGSLTASESSGNAGAQMDSTGSGTDVVFGNATGPAVDGLTAATFADGKYLAANITPSVPRGIHATVKVNALPSLNATIAFCGPVVILLDSAGVIYASSGGTIFGPNINDGRTHDVTFTLSNGAGLAELFVDGVSAGTSATTSTTESVLTVGPRFTGVVSHVAYFDSSGPLITASDAASMSTAVLTGFAGDRTDVRLLRALGWGGVTSTEVDTEVGVETMDYQQAGSQSVMDVLHDVEATEGGVLFDGADGKVKFHNRPHRYLATPAATLNMASQHVGSDYAPRLDRSALVNDVTVENPTTGEKARAVNTASTTEYGIASGSATSVANSYDPLQQKASWTVASYAEPRMRVPSLTVDVLAHQGLTPSAQTLLAATVGDLLAVTNAPTQSDTTSPSYFVEGYTETIGPESYSLTFNLSPTYPTLNVFVLDDAARGVLDTGILAL